MSCHEEEEEDYYADQSPLRGSSSPLRYFLSQWG